MNESICSQRQPGIQLEKGNWIEDNNYIRPGKSSIRNDAYRYWYETTHPQPHSLDQVIITYSVNRRWQLKRCQANHPLSYEAFLHANQPAGGHPANDTWDYGQLYRLHMIRAQAAHDIPRWGIIEEDVDNYLIQVALSERQRDIDATNVQPSDHPEYQTHDATADTPATSSCEDPETPQGIEQTGHPQREQRRTPWRKRTTTNQEDIFFPSIAADAETYNRGTSNTNTVGSDLKVQASARQQKNPKYIRNISAFLDTGAQVTTMPESAVSKMPNANNHRDPA